MKTNKQIERKKNLTFSVEDMIQAMSIALEEYGNIPVGNLLIGCYPTSMNVCIYNKRENMIYFKRFAGEADALANKTEDEEIVYGIQLKE